MDLMELIGWIKSNSTTISCGTSGPGTPSHASGLLLQKLTGVQVQYVPYRGGSLVLQDLIAGQIDVTFGALSTSLPAVRDGKIKAYAVTSNRRSAAAPNIATVDEAGLPGLHLSLSLGRIVGSQRHVQGRDWNVERCCRRGNGRSNGAAAAG